MLGAAYIGSPRPHDRLHARLWLQLHPQVGQPVYCTVQCTKPGMRIRIWSQLFTFMRIRIQLIVLMQIRIRILLLIKVVRICDHWSTGPPGLHFETSRLHCGRPRLPSELPNLLNFDFNADPDPAFHSVADPDPASPKNADPDPQPWRKPKISEDKRRTGFLRMPNIKAE